MNKYDIQYEADDGSMTIHSARALDEAEAEAYFNTRTPFKALSVTYAGPNEDAGKPPKIGPD